MKHYTFWLKAAMITQFIFVLVHTPTLFLESPPANDTEKQIYGLLESYKFDFGMGFQKNMNQLIFDFSAALTLFMLMGALINLFLIRKKADNGIMLGIIQIQLLSYGLFFLVTALYAFHFPILLSGLIFVFLLISRIQIQNN